MKKDCLFELCLSGVIIATVSGLFMIMMKTENSYDVGTIKDASVIGIEKVDVKSSHSNTSYNNIRLDVNNNGIFDKGDIEIRDGFFPVLPEVGKNVIYLDGNYGYKPLAYQNGNGNYEIIKKPSSYFPDGVSKKIDNKFLKYMKNKSR